MYSHTAPYYEHSEKIESKREAKKSHRNENIVSIHYPHTLACSVRNVYRSFITYIILLSFLFLIFVDSLRLLKHVVLLLFCCRCCCCCYCPIFHTVCVCVRAMSNEHRCGCRPLILLLRLQVSLVSIHSSSICMSLPFTLFILRYVPVLCCVHGAVYLWPYHVYLRVCVCTKLLYSLRSYVVAI